MKEFDRLVEIVHILRSENGCPWDREQNLYSLRDKLIEEVFELVDALDNKDIENINEELGDVLLHVVMHSVMAEEDKLFTVESVAKSINEKLIRRHPHVFGNDKLSTASEVIIRWDEIKKEEKKKKRESILDKAPASMPSLPRASRLQKIASKVGFDWKDKKDILNKLYEEVGELKEAISQSDKEKITDEFGDILFTIVNIGNHLEIDTDEALRMANKKFYRRFNYIEKCLKEKNSSFEDSNLEEMDMFWNESKKSE